MEKLFKICELVLPDFDNFFLKSSLKANIQRLYNKPEMNNRDKF